MSLFLVKERKPWLTLDVPPLITSISIVHYVLKERHH